MKILIISQVFYPETFRINDIARELVKRGNEVTVATGQPNYPQGKLYEGYGYFKTRKEKWDGVNILRLPIITRGKNKIRLFLNYYSFVVSGFFWQLFSRQKPDIIFSFETSPVMQLHLGKWFSKKRHIPHIVYIQDLWPESLEFAGHVHIPLVLNHYQRFCDAVYNSAHAVLTTSPALVKKIQAHTKNPEKVLFYPQYAENCDHPTDKKSNLIPDDGRFYIAYCGNIGYAQGLSVLPETAKLLDDSVCFVLVGGGRYLETLKKETEEVKNRFLFIDPQPKEKISEILASVKVAFFSYENNPFWDCYIPAKMQTYLACGKPILASAGGEAASIIKEANCGICTPNGDARALAEAVRSMKDSDLSQMGENALSYSKAHFDKEKILAQLETLMKQALNEDAKHGSELNKAR